MKFIPSVFLSASASLVSALTQDCTGSSPTDEGGNWFCGAVSHILYEGIVGQGQFSAVTSMGPNGECNTEEKTYSGPLAPLDEDLSIHIRGPFELKEAAVYNLAQGNNKREATMSPHVHARRHGNGHGHQHLHNRDPAGEKRADIVTATIDGIVQTWENNYFGPTEAPAPEPAPAPAPAPDPVAPSQPAEDPPSPSSKPKAKPKTKPKTNGGSGSTDNHSSTDGQSTAAGGGAWSRIAYYNAEQQVTDNMVFMGNYGGQGSGVWDTTWGNSLSFLNAEGNGGASSPQILQDTLIPSNTEFAIFSSEKCDEGCGFSRVKDVAYKGFSGANKVFLFRFRMPLDGDRGFNGDMPALWALNGKIPRTQQYGSCSCWETGCGEADIYEVLASGDTKCKSTFHLQNGAGSSDYFERPVDDYIRVAAVFDEASASVSIQRLPDDLEFSEGLAANVVKGWMNGGDNQGVSSVFQVSS